MSKDSFAFLNNLTDTERSVLEDGLELKHYAIFNTGVDHNLLELVLDGKEKLTDGLFFKLLAEETAYLGTVLFQKRILEWRGICQWPELHSKKEVAIARENLKKIGRVLSRSGLEPGSPERIPHNVVRNFYTENFNFIEKLFSDTGKKPSSRLLTKTYPQFSKAFQDETGRHEHRSLKEIAIRLTRFRLASREKPLKVSLKTLRKIINNPSI
jgi:hypothetical protein